VSDMDKILYTVVHVLH